MDIITEKVCRCCLSTVGQMYDMKTATIISEEIQISRTLLEEYQTFTNLHITQEEKVVACRICFNRLKDIFDFRVLCRKSSASFQQKIDSVKSEPIDDDFDLMAILNVVKVEPSHPKDKRQNMIRGFARNLSNSPDYEAEWEDKQYTDSKFIKAQYYCVICDNQYSYYEAIYKHKRRRQCSLALHKKFHRQCKFCQVEVKGGTQYESHLTAVHPDFRPQKCLEDDCGEQYLRPTELREHLSVQHTVSDGFRCNGCFKYYPTKQLLRKHVQKTCKHNPTMLEVKEKVKMKARTQFACSWCAECFTNNQKLQNHRKEMHKNRKNHLCSDCGKKFVSSERLAIHAMDHTMERPFTCDECEFTTKTEKYLANHKRKQHMPREKTERLECDRCKKKYPHKWAMLGHLRREHFPDLGRSFKCNYCPRKFLTSAECENHIRTHTGERPHKCQIENCRNTYRSEHGLITHIKARHTQLRYECRFCNAKFVSKHGIFEHVFKHRKYFPFNCPACSYGCYQKPVFKNHLSNKHAIVYQEATHGYTKETVDEVIATCLKISKENEKYFTDDKSGNNMKLLTEIAMEQSSENVPNTSSPRTDSNYMPFVPFNE